MNHGHQRQETNDKEDEKDAFDPTSLFEQDKTKRLLFREEPKIAKLSQHNVRLIDTTNALFLRNLTSMASSATKDDERGSGCVTLRDLRAAISSNDSFRFLEPSIDDLEEKRRFETPYFPPKKRKRSSATKQNDNNTKKARSVLGDNEEEEKVVADAVLAVSNNDKIHSSVDPTSKIVPDEEDYD